MRSRDPERFQGAAASRSMQDALTRADSGLTPSRSLDGMPTVVAYVASDLSGWTTAVVVSAKIRRTTTDASPRGDPWNADRPERLSSAGGRLFMADDPSEASGQDRPRAHLGGEREARSRADDVGVAEEERRVAATA